MNSKVTLTTVDGKASSWNKNLLIQKSGFFRRELGLINQVWSWIRGLDEQTVQLPVDQFVLEILSFLLEDDEKMGKIYRPLDQRTILSMLKYFEIDIDQRLVYHLACSGILKTDLSELSKMVSKQVIYATLEGKIVFNLEDKLMAPYYLGTEEYQDMILVSGKSNLVFNDVSHMIYSSCDKKMDVVLNKEPDNRSWFSKPAVYSNEFDFSEEDYRRGRKTYFGTEVRDLWIKLIEEEKVVFPIERLKDFQRTSELIYNY